MADLRSTSVFSLSARLMTLLVLAQGPGLAWAADTTTTAATPADPTHPNANVTNSSFGASNDGTFQGMTDTDFNNYLSATDRQFRDQITAKQNEMAGLQNQFADCARQESKDKTQANADAIKSKADHLGNAINGVTGGLGKVADAALSGAGKQNGDSKQQMSIISKWGDQMRGQLSSLNSSYGGEKILSGSPGTWSVNPSGCNQGAASKAGCTSDPKTAPCPIVLECYDQANSMASQVTQKNSDYVKSKQDNTATNNLLAPMVTTAIQATTAALGYSLGVKGDAATQKATLEGAKLTREGCEANITQQINGAQTALNQLAQDRANALAYARYQYAQWKAQAKQPDVVTPDPNLKLDTGNNTPGGTASVPNADAPTSGSTASTNPTSTGTSPNQSTLGGTGGGGSGGGSGGGDGPPKWSFGGGKGGAPGGGGLPAQPDAVAYGSDGGGGGGGGGFGSAPGEEKTAAKDGAGEGDRSPAGETVQGIGDGGLFVLMNRARELTSRHAVELLSGGNVRSAARSNDQTRQPASIQKN